MNAELELRSLGVEGRRQVPSAGRASGANKRADLVCFDTLRTCRLGPGYFLMLLRQREKDRSSLRRSFFGQFRKASLAAAE